MVAALLDTSIVVDILRAHPAAVSWFENANLQFGVTKFVWMETIQGARSKHRQTQAIELLRRFELVVIELADIDWALEALTQQVLANSGLDMKDALIASTSVRLDTPLFTRNLKHYHTLIGDLARQPY